MKIVTGVLLSLLPVANAFTDVSLLKELNRDGLVDSLLNVTAGTPSTTFNCATDGTVIDGCCMEALELGCFYHEIYFWHYDRHYDAGYDTNSGEFWKDHTLSDQADFPGWRYKDYYAWLAYRESTHGSQKTLFDAHNSADNNFKSFVDWTANTFQHDDGTGHLDEVCQLFDEYAIACSGRKTMPYDSDATTHATLGTTDYGNVACPTFSGQDSLRFDVAKSTPETDIQGVGMELQADDPNAIIPRLYTMGVIAPEKQDMSLSCHCMREIVANNPGAYAVPETSRCYDVVTKSACERQPCGPPSTCSDGVNHDNELLCSGMNGNSFNSASSSCFKPDGDPYWNTPPAGTVDEQREACEGTPTGEVFQTYGGYCEKADGANNDYLKITAPWELKSYKLNYRNHRYQVGGTWFDWPQQSRVFRYWDSYDVATRSPIVAMDLQRTCSCYPGWDKTPYNAETNAMETCNIDRAYCPTVGTVTNDYPAIQGLACDNGFYQNCGQEYTPDTWTQLQAPDNWEIIIEGVPEMEYYPDSENNEDHGKVNEWGVKCFAQLDDSWEVAPEFYDGGAPRIQTGDCVEQNTSFACTCWSRDKLASISSAYYDNLPMATNLKERSVPETRVSYLNKPENVYSVFSEGGACGPVTVNETQCANYYKTGIKEFRTQYATYDEYVSKDMYKCGQLVGVSAANLGNSYRKNTIKDYDGTYVNNQEQGCFEICRDVVETANGCRWIDGTPVHDIPSVALMTLGSGVEYSGTAWYTSHAIAAAQDQVKSAGGSTCNEPTIKCDASSCIDPHGNIGTCTNGDGMYTCACEPGWTDASLCQESIDDCASTPCKNGGVCTDGHQDFTCECAGTGYTGPTCEVDVNECDTNDPCHPGGLCTNTAGSYQCGCYDDWDGDDCDVIINDCNVVDCGHGSCQDGNTTYVCNCAAGWEKDNPGDRPGNCTEDINECLPNDGLGDCDTNAVCTNSDGGHSCSCKTGWTGNGFTCSDINECTHTGAHQHDCGAYSDCTNTDGGFTCQCWNHTGITDEGDQGKDCASIDECDLGEDDCHAHATCVNAVPHTINHPGYYCNCNDGWEGNGVSCTDVDECLLNDGKGDCDNGVCWDSLTNDTIDYDKRVCVCEPGYATNFQGRCTTDVNECTDPDVDGDTLCANGVCVESGTDASILATRFECNCAAGWKGGDKDYCTVEINECVETTPTVERCVEANTASCTDQVNARTCHCKDGYGGDTCQTALPCQASDNSTKDGTDGQFYCIHGGTIGGTTGTDTCTCACADGYSGPSCEIDNNECSPDPCKNGATCTESDYGATNVQADDYSCACTAGWKGKDCDESINDCLRTLDGSDLADGGDPCTAGDAGCASPCKHNSPCTDAHLNYTCDCDHAQTQVGWEGKQCHVSINNCDDDPCCDTNTGKFCTEGTTTVSGAVCTDGYTDEQGVFNHDHRTCNCNATDPPMYGQHCQKLIIQGCMDDEKINYDPDANHDDGTTRCKGGDDVYTLPGFTDRGLRLKKWTYMQERKYTKDRTDGLNYNDKSKRKEIRKKDRIVIKNEDYLNAALSKLNTIGFGARPKRLEVGSKNNNEAENCAGKVLGGGLTLDFVGVNDDCVTTVLDDEEGEGDQKTLTRRALPDQTGSWQVIGKTIGGDVKPIIKQVRTGDDAYTMSCWEDNAWTQETQGLSEGMDFQCAKTRHRVLVGSVTDYPAPCKGLLNEGCTSEQKTEAYLGRSDGVTDCSNVTPDPDRDIAGNEADTADCKTLGCTTQQIVDSFTCS